MLSKPSPRANSSIGSMQPTFLRMTPRGTGCIWCGPAVRSEGHMLHQYGASAHRVGRRVMAAAHVLHYGVGVPVRKVPAVLRALTGVELTQGALSQDALRRARGLGDAYHKLRGSVRPVLSSTNDDGEMACAPSKRWRHTAHRNEEVRDLPSDYGGVTDRGRMLRLCRGSSSVRWSNRNRLSRLPREAGAPAGISLLCRRGRASETRPTYHLRDRPMSDADSTRLDHVTLAG